MKCESILYNTQTIVEVHSFYGNPNHYSSISNFLISSRELSIYAKIKYIRSWFNQEINTVVVCERVFGIGFLNIIYRDGKATIASPALHPRRPKQSEITCEKNVSKTVMELCDGKPSCSVTNNEVIVLSNPCPVNGFDKFLEVQYFCMQLLIYCAGYQAN